MYSNSITENLPGHIAIIIDGNGRWAERQGQARSYGHQAGIKNLHSIIELSVRLDIKYLTIYAFSKENWQRPKEEIAYLMDLFVKVENPTQIDPLSPIQTDPPLRFKLTHPADSN